MLSTRTLTLITLFSVLACLWSPCCAVAEELRAVDQWAVGVSDLQTASGYYKEGKYDEAIALLEKSIPREPCRSIRKSMLGVLADTYSHTGQPDKRVGALKAIITLFPKEEGILLKQMGLDLMGQGKHEEAIPVIKSAIDKLHWGNHLCEAFKALAQCYDATGQTDKGKKALTVIPAYDLQAQGKCPEAVDLCREMLKSEKDKTMRKAMFICIAECCHCPGRWEEKREAFESIIALCPAEEGPWRISWSADLQTQGKLAESTQLLEQLARKEWPKDVRVEILTALGDRYATSQEWDKKRRVVESLMEFCPERQGNLQYDLANDLRAQGKHAESIPYYEKSLAKLVESDLRYEAWVRMACAYARTDHDKGLDACLEQMKLKPESPDWMGRALLGASDVLVNEGLDVQRGFDLLDRLAAQTMNNEWDKAICKSQTRELLNRYRNLRLWDKKSKMMDYAMAQFPEDEGSLNYEVADDLRLQGKHKEAIPFYEKALPKLPTPDTRFWGWLWMARAYAHADHDKGLDSCLERLKQQSEGPDWMGRIMAHVLEVLMAEGVDAKRGVEVLDWLAAQTINNAWDKATCRAHALDIMGRYASLGQWEKKAKMVDYLMAQFPEDEGLWNYERANDLCLQRKYKESIPLYKKSLPKLSIPDQRCEAWMRMACAYAHFDHDKGLDACLEQIKENAESPDWMGRALLRACDVLVNESLDTLRGVELLDRLAAQTAKNEWDKTMCKSQTRELLNRYGSMRLWGKKSKMMDYAMAQFPEDEGSLNYEAADDLRLQGKCKEAIPFYEKALPKLPTPGARYWGWLWMARAYAYADHDTGLDSCLERLRLKSESPEWMGQIIAHVLEVLIGGGVDAERGVEVIDWLAAHTINNAWDKATCKAHALAIMGRYAGLGQWEKKAKMVDYLMAQFPEDEGLWNYERANDLCLQGKYQECLAITQKAMPSANADLAKKLATLQIQAYLKLDDWSSAESVRKSMAAAHPEEEGNWCGMVAENYHSQGKTADAIAFLEKMIPDAPSKDAKKKMNIDLAHYCVQAGLWEKSAKALDAAIEICPEERAVWRDYIARDTIGQAYNLQGSGEHAKAISIFRDVINRFADCPYWVESAHVCVAECMQGLGNTDEAIAYAKRLYDEHSEMRGGALFAEGMVNVLSKRYYACSVALRRLIAEYPGDMHTAASKTYLIFALRELGQTDEAIGMLKEKLAAESGPEQRASVLLEIAMTYDRCKKYRDALSALKQAKSLENVSDETKAEAAYRSGLCYQAMGYGDSARICMGEVTKHYPDSRWAREARGTLYSWSCSSGGAYEQ